MIVAYTLTVIYLGTPWVTIGGKQAILLNIFERKFTFFGATFWATDTYFLALILGGLAISLFFFKAIFGRIWCGWGCPETIFLEFIFRPVESLIEGGPAQRLRLDNAPWTPRKIAIKFLKFSVFAILVWILASTTVIYFVGLKPWLAMITGSPFDNWLPFVLTIGIMTGLGFQFGWFREQFCTVLCPYARFQSVLLDSHSLLVGYDVSRGEPRGKAGTVSGDCIDCGLCVRVCPTGIDIRNGLQLECIQCAACADACDSVMEKLGRTTGLVRYDTEVGLAQKKTRFIRPRSVIYGLIGLSLATTFFYLLLHRNLTDVQILRDGRDQTFQVIAPGRITNHIHIQVGNKQEAKMTYSVTSADKNVELLLPANPFPVGGGQLITMPLFVNFSETVLNGGMYPVILEVTDEKGKKHSQTITLLGPG